MHMRTTLRYILLCALRDRLFLGLVVGVLVAGLFAVFMGAAAFLENAEMTLTIAASVSRAILMVGMIVFVCFQVRSHFDTKELDVLLTRPVTRESVVCAYMIGFGCVATLACVPAIMLLACMGPLSKEGFALWAMSLVAEGWVVVAMALFASMVLRSAVLSVLATLGMYVLARMMVLFLMSSEHVVGGVGVWVGAKALQVVSVVMPRLDLFAKSRWLVYGVDAPDAWALVCVQWVICVGALLLATMIDFRKKQF